MIMLLSLHAVVDKLSKILRYPVKLCLYRIDIFNGQYVKPAFLYLHTNSGISQFRSVR